MPPAGVRELYDRERGEWVPGPDYINVEIRQNGYETEPCVGVGLAAGAVFASAIMVMIAEYITEHATSQLTSEWSMSARNLHVARTSPVAGRSDLLSDWLERRSWPHVNSGARCIDVDSDR